MAKKGGSKAAAEVPAESKEKDPPPPPCPSKLELLLEAADVGDIATIQKLGTHINVNHCDDRYSLSLLGWAANNGHLDCVEALLKMGAATELTDIEGYTPLHRATWQGHQDVIAALVDRGSNVDARARIDGATPLGLACSRGDVRTAEFLIKYAGADVNAQDGQGRTALVKAAMAGHHEAVEWLLRNGADSTITPNGDTPHRICERAAAASRTVAQRKAYRAIVNLLAAPVSQQSVATMK
eukprot:Sspe_Gene.46872::Locus_23577_Transcript_1_1_Confidence_1.000_Length_815::g.46872::m.46872